MGITSGNSNPGKGAVVLLVGKTLIGTGIKTFPSLYIHVPFCSLKCDYCDFYSQTTLSVDFEKRYLSALERQLEYSLTKWGICGFSTVYIGGGTPSLLSSEGILRLINLFVPLLSADSTEITFEANPESLTREKISLLEESCINRISMGVQSFFPDARKYIGRRGTLEDIYTALSNIEELWNGSLSLDFIRGLPGGIHKTLYDELQNINVLQVDHLSLYDLTLEPGTPLAMRKGLKLPSVPEELSCDRHFLQKLGLQRYEVSNYAKPGAESRHNQGYWEMNPYLGLGPSAVSLIYEGGSKHVSVAHALEEYLADTPKEYLQIEHLNRADLFIEHLIMGFRQVRGLSLVNVQSRFGMDLEAIIPYSINRWFENRMCVSRGGRVFLTENAFAIQNRLVLEAWDEIDNGKPFA